MSKIEVKSTSLKSIEYFLEIQMLEVEFVKGSVYDYFDVPQEIYDALINAESVGSFFSKNISKSYVYKKMK